MKFLNKNKSKKENFDNHSHPVNNRSGLAENMVDEDLDEHEYNHENNIPHNHDVHTHDLPSELSTTNNNNENNKEDIKNIYIYMQYLLITLIPIFVLLILSSFGVISQAGAAIIILAILVIVMMMNYRSIYNSINADVQATTATAATTTTTTNEEENRTRPMYHRHDPTGRMQVGEGDQFFNDLIHFNDNYYNPDVESSRSNLITALQNQNSNNNSNSSSGVNCPNGKKVWENYLDKYNLLKDSNDNDVSPPTSEIKEILIKYSKVKNADGIITNPVKIDEIELFKQVGDDDTDATASAYPNDDGIINILPTGSSKSLVYLDNGTTVTDDNAVNTLTDLSFNSTSDAWYPGYEQERVEETIKLTLTMTEKYNDLYALVIYTPDDQCLGGSTVEIKNNSEVLHSLTLGVNGNVHLIKFGASGAYGTIEKRAEATYNNMNSSNNTYKKREYQVPYFAENREEYAVQHYADNLNNKWDCTTETFANLNETNKKQGNIMTMFSKEDLPKQLEFNTQFYSELKN